ncbi:MAG: ABC-ATPase domain-containing protein [Planctomycetota bacterium]
MATIEDLRGTLGRIDGRGYKAYKDIQGSYDFPSFRLHVDHVQGDPFASPSKIRARVPQSVPEELFRTPVRRIALQDFLARCVHEAIRGIAQGRRGTGKSGMVSIDAGGQEVLERTAVKVAPEWIEARIQVGLPAAGRRVLGRQAEEMLCRELPRIVERGLDWKNVPQDRGREFVERVEDQEHVRGKLEEMGLVAFVADGSILPRESGVSERPMSAKDAVPFRSPESMRVTVDVPNEAEPIAGMGIPKGVTLIVGGGYHGKSTLLRALERGVYAHVPGDGRERVVTSGDAVKIRAEDGRRVERVDISPFISNLPRGRSTEAFSSDDASGSTSQAANIVEAVEAGAKALLLDEDTSATNFMLRDARMQELVHRDHEPITPFLDRVRGLYDAFGVSTVLVMGGCGDYFDVADTVVMMKEYVPEEATAEAKRIADGRPSGRAREEAAPLSEAAGRVPVAESFDPSRGRREVKIDAKEVDLVLFGTDAIDLRGVEQLVDLSQTRAVGYAIHLATERFMDGRPLRDVVDEVERFFDEHGLDALDPFRRGERHPGNFARPRKYELAAAINRLRTVRMKT